MDNMYDTSADDETMVDIGTKTDDDWEEIGQTVNNASDNESKADKFKRLAQFRTRRLITYMESLGKLSGSNYEYTEDQINKIFTAIENSLEENRSKFFKTHTKDKKDVFVLD